MKPLIIGSRGSRLARHQAKLIEQSILSHNPNLVTRIEIIRTSGDTLSQPDLAHSSESIKGLFVKELEEALLRGQVDLSVHSLKDLPSEQPEGLCLAAIPEREDPRDVLVAAVPQTSFSDLPPGARLGTGSLRRTVQLRSLREDLSICPVRGNIDTRIGKMKEKGLDGVVLAAAGLKRLELQQKISYVFPVQEMIPAVGQGALAVEIRSDDMSTRRVVEPLGHRPSQLCTLAERQFMKKMGGGCQLPMGAHAHIRDGEGTFSAFIASPEPLQLVQKISHGKTQDLEELALEAADYLLAHGGDEILRKLQTQ